MGPTKWLNLRIETAVRTALDDLHIKPTNGRPPSNEEPPLAHVVLEAPQTPVHVHVIEPAAPDLVLHRRDRKRAVTSEDPELAALLNEQSLLVQKDNIILGAIITLVSVGAILVGFYLSQFPHLCEIRPTADNCIENKNVYLLAPIPVLASGGILIFLTLQSHITASLLHKVELEVQKKIDFTIPPDASKGETHPIALPSSGTLTGLVFTPTRARSLRVYYASNLVTLVAIMALIVGLLFPVMSRLPGSYQLLALAIYGPQFAILFVAFQRATFSSRRLLRDATSAHVELLAPRVTKEYSCATIDPTTGRRPLGYLVLARPTELLFKSGAILAAVVLTRLVTTEAWIGRWYGLLAVASFELLLYQARYMLNDAVDLDIDKTNTRSVGKGRSPHMGSRTRAIVRLAAVVRLAIFGALLGWAIPGSAARILLAGSIAVLLLMGPYDRFSEFSRRRWGLESTRWQTLRGNRGQSPNWLDQVPASPALVRLLLVSPGYAIRASVGVALALNGWPEPYVVLVVGVALGALEASNVALGWVSEGISHFARGTNQYRQSLGNRPHMAWLVLHAGLVERDAIPVRNDLIPKRSDRGSVAALIGSPRVNGPRVWNVWMMASLAAGGGAGFVFDHRLTPPGLSNTLITVAITLAPATLMLVPSVSRRPVVRHLSDWMIIPATVGTGAVVHLRASSTEAQLLWPGWAIVSLLAVVYMLTRLSSYEQYVETVRRISEGSKTVLGWTAATSRRVPRFILGFFIGTDLYP